MHKIIYLLTTLIIVGGLIYYGNNAIEVTAYTLENNKWPSALNGYKIVHLSDLQSKSYGKDQSPLLNKVKALNPDLIVFTGDLIDRRHYALDPAIKLMEGLTNIAPTTYVTGNHEIWHGTSNTLKSQLEQLGVLVLDNRSMTMTKNDASFKISGIADRAEFMGQNDYESYLTELNNQNDHLYSLLLSHRPEQLKAYANSAYDLVFAGHSHGGQFQLPFVGGLFSPNQGVFPEFDGGIYKDGNTQLIVSRGLGNSIIPIRILNQPEIPVITMIHKASN